MLENYNLFHKISCILVFPYPQTRPRPEPDSEFQSFFDFIPQHETFPYEDKPLGEHDSPKNKIIIVGNK